MTPVSSSASAKLIRGGTIVRAAGEEKADVLIQNGMIVSIGSESRVPSSASTAEIIDATGLLLFPGIIDCHVHFREPGLTQKGDMRSESRAAIRGGVTTVCDMPNTIPPTVTVAALADKVRRAEGLGTRNSELENFDIRFFFGITEEAHLRTLQELWTGTSNELERLKSQCCGVKLYLDHSTGNQKIEGGIVEDVFRACADMRIPLVAHCEDAEMNKKLTEANAAKDIAAHSDLRPPESEEKAIAFAIGLARKYGTQFHCAHLSTKQGLALVAQAKKDGLSVTCEVAPHHLFLSVDDYPALGTLAKMNPPLRTKDHCEALLSGLTDGTVDCIATDHAPHTLAEKKNEDPLKAPSGVPGVETMLPLLLTLASGCLPHGQRMGTRNSLLRQGFGGQAELGTRDIVRLCFENPNRIFSLGKKNITEGAPANIVIVDAREEWMLSGADLHSKCGWTPYEGWNVQGRVKRVIA
jgi:dihydroorotase